MRPARIAGPPLDDDQTFELDFDELIGYGFD
jgi:hypothetical protein